MRTGDRGKIKEDVAALVCDPALCDDRFPNSRTVLRYNNRERGHLRGGYSGAAICLIIPCSSAPTLSNTIIQKGLAFGRDWSGSVVNSGR
jgi:hypothetical protein